MFQLLDSLTMHQYDIITQRLKEGVNSHTPTPGLPKKAFRLLLANSLGVHHDDCRIVALSRKVRVLAHRNLITKQAILSCHGYRLMMMMMNSTLKRSF